MGGLSSALPFIDAGTALLGMTQRPNFGPTNDLMNAASGNIHDMGDLSGIYRNISSNQSGMYNAAQGAQTDAANKLSQFYNNDPYSDQYNTGQIANATGGMDAAFQRGNANAIAQNAGQNGGAGGPSSTLGGMEAYNNSSAMGNISQLRSQLAQKAMAQRQSNLQNLYNLQSGLANQSFGRMMGTSQAQGGELNSMLGGNQRLAGTAFNMAMGPMQQAQNEVSSGLGGLGQYAGFNAMRDMWGGNSNSNSGMGMGALMVDNPATSGGGYMPTSPTILGENYDPSGGYGGLGGYNPQYNSISPNYPTNSGYTYGNSNQA